MQRSNVHGRGTRISADVDLLGSDSLFRLQLFCDRHIFNSRLETIKTHSSSVESILHQHLLPVQLGWASISSDSRSRKMLIERKNEFFSTSNRLFTSSDGCYNLCLAIVRTLYAVVMERCVTQSQALAKIWLALSHSF